MEKNYCVDGQWFSNYQLAKTCSEQLMKLTGKYYVVYTKAEMDSITKAIDHEMECGK